ncbi:MAG: RnfH family protein [Alphaproteobacteria bacterium]|nr:RnfH family protein [Alphaproteobacteria bacterium]
MKVGVSYALPQRQIWLDVEVDEGATVQDVIERSGILQQFPEIDLSTQKIGVFGQLAKLDQVLEEGDRVEIYRPITVDPKTVKRKRKIPGAKDDD